ncbi:hypothetical protein DAEQUDRAFT_766778 [Daedalea quercina L-15889]|uniref:Uncharacterized protein n=1 Tax=Daedalea quercina L-15889 TaxID=1314783 RepID=A0A165P6B3_9APHY|nr:hypothetical protein DAEQUDRAFT_766778 [Daedalea quercina L-15889]
MTKQSGGSSNEAMDLKSNQITAAMPPQRSEQEVWSGEQENVKEGSRIIEAIFATEDEPTTTAHESTANAQTEVVWNDEEIWETSSTADEKEFVIGLAKRREARDVTDSGSMEAWETSTTIEEAEMLTGHSLRRDPCDQWQPNHFCANSGSTASSTSITTISDVDTSPASARARAWANVSAALSSRICREELACTHL